MNNHNAYDLHHRLLKEEKGTPFLAQLSAMYL